MKSVWIAALLALALVYQGGGQSRAQDVSDWSVQCQDEDCAVYAEIRLDSGVLFSSIEFRKFGKEYGGVIRFPLGTHVPSGYLIGIDKQTRIKARLLTCRKMGCEAVFKADKKTLAAFKRGLKMSVVFTRVDTRKRVALNYSLEGFTQVWNTFQAMK